MTAVYRCKFLVLETRDAGSGAWMPRGLREALRAVRLCVSICPQIFLLGNKHEQGTLTTEN